MARRRETSSSAGLFAIVAFVGLIGAAIYVAVIANKKQLEEQQATETSAKTEEYEPFKEFKLVDPYAERDTAGDAPFSGVETPENLLKESVWQQAIKLAGEGYELAAQAVRAEKSGERLRYEDLGRRAERAFDRAFSMTADWEQKIVARYGERAEEVQEIMRTRNKWSEKVQTFRKTVPR